MNRWANLPLRIRLTFLYMGLLALLLSLLETFLYWDTRRFLIQTTATRLRAQAKPVIERWLYSDGAPPSIPPLPTNAAHLAQIAAPLARDLTSRDTAALVLARDGTPLAEGRLLPEEPSPPPPIPHLLRRALSGENEITYITTADGQRTLIILIPLRATPGSTEILGVVQISTSLAPVEQILARQRLLLGLGGAVTLGAGTLLGLWLTSSTLSGLTRMVETCRRIAEGDLSQRVNLPHHRDEVGMLARAFDEMVSRLEALFEAQRRFVANAAHELRTPLTALQGSLEVLMRGAQDDPAAVARLTQGMYREVTRLSRLCEQLLDLSRLESAAHLHRRPLEIVPYFDALLPQLRLLVREGTLRVEHGPAATLYADPDALTQVIFNLVANAVQHNAPGVTLTLGWAVEGAAVRFWVTDDGAGIPPQDLPHIFEPFYRGDHSRSRRRGGAGLGLALTRAIVEASGGHIRVRSHPGAGTTFTFTLPLAHPS